MVKVNKIPPLMCPNCNSTRVVRMFNKRKGRAYLATPSIVCYDCESRGDLESGRTTKISIDEFEQIYLEKAKEQRLKNEKKFT